MSPTAPRIWVTDGSRRPPSRYSWATASKLTGSAIVVGVEVVMFAGLALFLRHQGSEGRFRVRREIGFVEHPVAVVQVFGDGLVLVLPEGEHHRHVLTASQLAG